MPRRASSWVALPLLVGGLGMPAAIAAGGAVETLEFAWQRALTADAEFAGRAAATEAARADERAARAARWPTLEATAGYTRFADAPALSVTTPDLRFSSPRIFDNDDTLMAGVQMQWPLFTGGALSAGIRAASSVRAAAEANEQAAAAGLKLTVAQLFVDVWFARRMQSASDASVEALQAHFSTVETMVAAGLRSRADMLASQVALAAAQDQQLQARHALALATGAYNRRLGYPLERVPALSDQLPTVTDLGGVPLADLQRKGLAQRAELTAVGAERDALTARSRVENGKRLPQLALLAGYRHFETTILDREDFSMVGVGLTWSLFDGGQARSKATALRRASEAVEWQRQSLASGVALEVQQHWLGLEAAGARAQLARDTLAQAEENLRVSRELYAVELIANTQVLEAVALQEMALVQVNRAAFDIIMARLQLLYSVGDL